MHVNVNNILSLKNEILVLKNIINTSTHHNGGLLKIINGIEILDLQREIDEFNKQKKYIEQIFELKNKIYELEQHKLKYTEINISNIEKIKYNSLIKDIHLFFKKFNEKSEITIKISNEMIRRK